jgi:hypothetical protein
MHPANRIRSHVFALTLALFLSSSDAGAQCLITGPTSLCNGPVQLCGPDGSYEYQWATPSGQPFYSQCVIASEPGVYTILLNDIQGVLWGPCSVTVTSADPPPCSITGPTSACAGSTIELCGPLGDLAYRWSGPNGFSDTAACIRVSVDGVYQLEVRPSGSSCAGTVCEQTVSFPACRSLENCPRTAAFWMRQCLPRESKPREIDGAQLAAVAGIVDDRAACFSWPDAVEGFCATVHPRKSSLRARAKRQFAAVLANVGAGELGLPPVGDHAIALDPATRVELPDVSTTIGEWLVATDARLGQLESLDRGERANKEAFRALIRVGWHINHGHGIGPVCSPPGPLSNAARLAALPEDDPEEPLAAELADDVSDAPLMAQATPNPSSGATTITYAVSGTSTDEVALAVYDLAGRKVRDLASGLQVSGIHEVRWDGRGTDGAPVHTGVYFVRGRVGDQRIHGQLTVLR